MTNPVVASQELVTASVPFVPMEECRQKVEESWVHYLTSDKICAGAKDPSNFL